MLGGYFCLCAFRGKWGVDYRRLRQLFFARLYFFCHAGCDYFVIFLRPVARSTYRYGESNLLPMDFSFSSACSVNRD